MKRVVSLILCFCILFSSVGSAQAIVLPPALKEIKAEAFMGDMSVTGVLTVPENVTAIGDRAFEGTGITGLDWGNSAVQSIGERAFANTPITGELVLAGIPAIGNEAFADTDVFAALFAGEQTIGDGVLRNTGATYALVADSADGSEPTFSDDALYNSANGTADVLAIAGVEGSSAQTYANSKGITFYDLNSCSVRGDIIYQLNDDNSLTAVLPYAQTMASGDFPAEIDNGEVVFPITAIGPHAFSNVQIEGDGFIMLPAGVELPENPVNWPDGIIADSDVQVTAMINEQPGQDYNDYHTGVSYDFEINYGYTQDYIDLAFQIEGDLTEEEREAFIASLETTIIVDDMNDEDEEHDENVAIVYPDGTLVVVNQGSAYITYIVSRNGIELSRAVASVYVYGGTFPMNISEAEMTIGEQIQLTPTWPEGDVTPESIRFYTEDDRVADVDEETGVVTAKGAGTTKIVAELYCYIPQKSVSDMYRTYTAECMVTVVDGEFTADRTEFSLYGGESAEIAFYNNTDKVITNVDWVSSNDGAVFAEVYEDNTGAIITASDGYYYPGHDRITFTATFEDGSTASITVHVAGEKPVVMAEVLYPYYQMESGSNPLQFQYNVMYAAGYSAEDVDVRYEVEVLECSSEDVELLTISEDGYMTVTDDASVTGIANVYAIFEYGGLQVAHISSGVIVNQGIPAIDPETVGFEFTEETFYINLNSEEYWGDYPFHVRAADDDVFDYYWAKYEVISEDDGNAETEDDTGLVLVLAEDGYWENMQPGTARIRATLVPHNPAEAYNVVTAEANVVLYAAEPYLTYEKHYLSGDSGYVETGEFSTAEKTYFYYGDVITAKIEGLPEGIDIEWTKWHVNEDTYQILAQDETTFTFFAKNWSQEEYETIDVEACFVDGSEFHLSYRIDATGLGDYTGMYLDPPAVTLSVGDEFGVNPFKEVYDSENGINNLDYNYYNEIYIDFHDQDMVEPVGGEMVEENNYGGDDGYVVSTAQLRAVKTGEAVVTVVGYHTWTDDNGEEYRSVDTMDMYVNVVEPEMTLEAFEPASVMYIGNNYDPSVAISYNGEHPALTFSFSEEGIVEMDYDLWKLVPVGEGTVDVTVTATKGDLEPQSLTKTVTVYGTDLAFAEGSRVASPAGTGGLILHIDNNTGKEIDHVLWSTDDDTVVLFYDQSTSERFASLETEDGVVDVESMTDEEGRRAEIIATVYFTDGTEKTIRTTVITREMAFIRNDYIELNPNESVYLDWGYESIAPNYMDFYSHDREVAAVSAQGLVTAVAPGETEIELYVANDSVWAVDVATVVVRDFTATLSPSELNLTMGQAAYLVPQTTVEEGYWIDDQRTGFWSMDDDVATVDHLGLVTAVAPGSTTIGYEAYTYYDDIRLVAYATVNVAANESGNLTISDSYVELHARERYQLTVESANADKVIAENGIEWISSDEDWLSVDENGLMYAFFWDIEEPRTVFVTANVTFTDGTTDSMICSVKLLPALISVTNSRNFYEIGVDESQQFEYLISINEEAWNIGYDVLFSVDEETGDVLPVVTVDEDGIMTGVNPGVALVRMTVMEVLEGDDESTSDINETVYGRNLFTGASYVYVDTPLPEPTEGCISFEFDHYYLSTNEHGGNRANIVDEGGLGVYYNMNFASDNEQVVSIDASGWMEPVDNGSATITAWLEGYEQYAATAKVTVGTPELSYEGVTEWDENNNPVITVGDVLTVKIENMPPFGNLSDEYITPNHINVNVDGNLLREIGRDDENNTITFLAMNEGWMDGSIEVNVNNDRNYWMWMGVQVNGREDEFTMDEIALVMAEEEIVQLWPHSDWEENWVSVANIASDNTDVLTVTEGTRCLLLKGVSQGHANVTAEYTLDDGRVITTTTSVVVGPYYWNVSFDDIPSVLYAGDRYDPWPCMDHGTYYEPEHSDWHISDESVAGIEEHDDGVWLVARQPGEFTLSMSFTMDNEGFMFSDQTTLMKTITVIERPYNHIEFAETEVEVRPGESFFVPLHINTDWQIHNVEYWSEDEGLVMAENILDGENASRFEDYDYEEHGEAVIITGVAANNSTRVFAKATFHDLQEQLDENGSICYDSEGNVLYVQQTDENGELVYDSEGNPVYVYDEHTAYASMRVKPIDDGEIYLNLHEFDGIGHVVSVTNMDWGEDGGETVVWLDYDTNAAVYGNGEDILTLNWSLDDPNIASIWDDEGNVRVEGYGVPQNGLWVRGLNPGGTTLHLNAVIWRYTYDDAGNVCYEQATDEEGNLVYDSEGNPVYDESRPVTNVICENSRDYWIEVNEPQLYVEFNNPNAGHDEYGTPIFELRGTDNRYQTSWYIHEEHVMHPLTEHIWVDDTNVATVSANGELVSVAPGETRVRVRVTAANGYSVENEAIVRVYGNDGDMGRADVGFYDDEMTIAAGTAANIAYYLNDNGYAINGEWWSSSDESVATVSKDGTVYGAEKGVAVITYHVDTEYGWHEAQCIVEVTGTHSGAWFAEDMLVLHRGSEATVGLRADGTIHADGGDPIVVVKSLTTSDENVLTAEVVTDANGGYILNEEGQPVIRFAATDWDNAKTYYITVTAEVEDYNGELQTATMLVIVPEQRLRIAGSQFGEGRWEHIDLFDWENPLTIRETYYTSDPDMNVEVEVTYDMTHDYDENGNITRTYPVIVWDEECGGYIGVAEGETTMYYTITADSGESYTYPLKVFVGGEDHMPDELKLREGYEVIVTALGDNNRYIDEAIDWPEYTGCEMAYEVIDQQLFYGGEGNVINLNEGDTRIYTENAGTATVRAYCPDDESLSVEIKVLVIGDAILTRVDKDTGHEIVYTGETVELGFRSVSFDEDGNIVRDENGDMVFGETVSFEALGLEVETWNDNGFGSDSYKVSDDAMTFKTYFWGEGEEWWHNIGVRFPDGYTWYTNYHYYLHTDNFFRVRLNNFQADEEFVGNPGERTDGELGWDSSIQEEFHVFWSSADESIATVDESGAVVLSANVEFTEENPSYTTEIIGTAMRWVGEGERDFSSFEGWETIASDSFPVRIIPVAKPNFEINTNGIKTVVVGDTLNMWVSEWDEKTNAPHHEFISGNTELLAPTGNYGEFIAVAPGAVTVTAKAWNGYTEENHQASDVDKSATMVYDTITIYVVEATPTIWLDYTDMRPNETCTVPLHIDFNGSDAGVETVEWTMTGETAIATLTPGENAEAGEYWVTLTDGVAGGYEYLTAKVTFTDGSMAETTCAVYVRPDDDIHVWSWHDDIRLSADGVLGANPTQTVVWQHFDTDAALTDHENPGTDYAEITWELVGQYDADGNETDQEIITLVSNEGEGLWNNGVTVKGNGIVGSGLLRATVRIYNAAGEELSSCEDWITVSVDGSEFGVWFDNYNDMDEDGTPVYYFDAISEDYRLIGWSTQEDNVTGSRREIFWSDDPSVVATDIHGNVQIVAPGETYIHVQIVFGEGEDTRIYEAGARVVVQYGEGNTQTIDLNLDQAQITIGVDETYTLTANVNDNGVAIYNQYWFNNNPAVVEILNDGTVYGIAPGVAMVKYCVETEYGQEEAICIVEVTGEAAAFRLGSNVVTLHTEQSTDVEIINETGMELSNVQIFVSNGDPISTELVEGEDGKQYARIHANDWGSSITKYETVTVTADTENGPVSAVCQVIIPIQKLRIVGEPFESDSNWWAMASGERMPVEAKWVVSETSLAERVREEITSDNAEVAYYDAETGEIVAVAQGETVIRYTVWVENEDGSQGETRTGEVTIFVDMDRMPEDVVAVHNPKITFLDWEYAGLDLDYQPFMTHTHTQFVSHNPEILTFDNENENNMHLHSEGMARVEVIFPENDSLNFDVQVLVIDQNNVQVRRVDVAEDDDPYRIGTLERAHVAFTDANGGQVIWEQHGIPVEYVFDEYDPNYTTVEVDENNQLFLSTTYTHTDSEIGVHFGVRFYDDLYLYKHYNFWIDGETPFAFAFLNNSDAREYVGVVGEHSQSNLSLCENYGALYGLEFAIRYESSNTDVATIDNDGWIDLVGAGETEVHAIASNWIASDDAETYPDGGYWEDVYVDGEQVRASFPVRVLAPYAPNFRITSENDVRMLNVGEELQLYIYTEDDPSTYVPQHTFESCDTSVLEPVLDENGEQVYGRFLAIAPGRVTVNATAWNGYDSEGNPITSGDSKEFIVVGQEPDVWMDDIAVRPGQTYTLPVGYNDNGTGIGIASVSVELSEAIADAAVTENNEIVFTNACTIPVEGEEFVIQDVKLTTTITLSNGTEHVRESNVHITVDEEIWVEPWHDEIRLSTESYGEYGTETVVWQSWHHNAAHYDEENPGTDTAWITWELVNPVDETTGETIVVAEMNGWFTDENQFLEENEYRAPWNNGPMVKAVSAGEALLKTTLTLYNADGEELASTTDEIPVYVEAPSVNLYFNEETYYLNVGEDRHLDYTDESSGMASVSTISFFSSDPSIVSMNADGRAVAHAPGEATITLQRVYNGASFTTQTQVVVTGVDVALESDTLTIARGESAKINLVIGESDYEVHNVWFESLDTGIATVNNDGYVYGVETGSTVVYAYIDHDFGTLMLPCVVHVTGDEDVLALSTHYAELFPEGEQEITYAYTGEGTPVSVRWYSTDDNYVFAAPITSNGEMTNRAMLIGVGEEPESDHYATVYCFLTVEKTAEDGSTYTEEQMDVALVKVNSASVSINRYQFGPGQWQAMGTGDWESIWESYTISDAAAERYGSFMIEPEITVENEEVIVYDGNICAVGSGESWAYYTLNLYKTDENGEKEYLAESYTARRKYYVDMDRTPDTQYARYNPQVALLEDGEGWLEIISEPEYTGCYTTFTSQNPEIITFDNPEDARFTIHGTGLANVDVVCPENEHLNFTAQVMVMDMNVLKLTRVDTEEGEDPYTVKPYETVQLGFVQEYTDGEGNVTNTEAPLWEQYGIPARFEAHRNYDPQRLYVTDDLQLTTTWTDFGEEIHHWVRVIFGEGESEQTIDVCYPFHIVQDETYFYAVAEGAEYAAEIVINPGDYVNIGYDTNIEWQDNYIFECYIGWDENGNQYSCVSVMNSNQVYGIEVGEAVVYARIMEEVPDESGDGATYYTIAEDSIPVRVIEPEVPDIYLNPENGQTVRLGEILQVWLAHNNENTFAPDHAYTSMDESILEPVYDENGAQVYGQFRAVGLGSTEIVADAYFGYDWQGLTASTSLNFYVIPGDVSVSFAQDHVDLRPGQTYTLPVIFNDNESGLTAESYTCSVSDESILSAEMTELEDGTHAVVVTRLAATGDAQVNVQATLSDGTTRGGTCTIGVVDEIYLNLTDQTIFLYTDEADGPTETDVYLTWETNAALTTDEENPGTDTLSISWSSCSPTIAMNGSTGADTATNNGVHVTAVAQGLTSFTGYITVKDAYGTVIAEGEAKVSVYVCNDSVNITLVDAPGATEYVGNVGDAVETSWTTDEWSSADGLPEGYSVLYKAVDQYGNENDVVTVDEEGWFYPQTCGEANIQVRIREAYVSETNGNTYYRVVAAGTFPIRVIAPETPNISITAEPELLTVGETVQLGILYNNSNTFEPWYYFTGIDGSVLEQVYDENGDKVCGKFNVIGINDAAETTVGVVATYGTSMENAQGENWRTFQIQAGSPNTWVDWAGDDMRPGQTKDFPLYYSDNASGVEKTGWTVESSNTDIVTAELVELESGEEAIRIVCLSAEADADVTVTTTLGNGETLTEVHTIETIANDEVTVEAEDSELYLSDAVYGTDPYETYVFVGWGTNAAVAGDPNRDGTDYAKITNWWVENPEGVTVITSGDTVSDDGNGLFVRGETAGTATLHATVNIYAEDDTLLAQDTADITVTVSEATFSMSYMSESYGYMVNRSGYPELDVSSDAMPDTATFTSSDERIFTTDVWGNVSTRSAGEATLTATYTFGSKSFSASTQIIVYGVEAYLNMDETTLAQGESMSIPYVLNDNGYQIYNSYWESANEDIATVTTDGKVYAVAPGTTTVTLYVNHDNGTTECVCVVNVTGEENGLTLSDNAMTVYLTNTAQLAYAYTGEGTLDESSVTWTSSDEELVAITENEDGSASVTANWVHNIRDDHYATVACEAQVNMGTEDEPVYETVRDICQIIIPAPKVWINGYQFGEGQWHALSTGEWMNIWETYGMADSSLTVTVSITVDDENVAIYDAESRGIRAIGAGETTAHYTVTASNGESYTASAAILVDHDIVPAEVRGAYAPQVVDLSLGWEWLNIEFVPKDGEEYAGCYVECESLNPEILSFNNPGTNEMTLYNEGLATVQITCPDYPELNTTAQVLVVDLNATRIVVLDGDDLYNVKPFTTTQLGFRHVSWDENGEVLTAPIWEREGVEVSIMPNGGASMTSITDDMKLTIRYTGGNVYQSFELVFNGGQTLYTNTQFGINNWDPYFVLTVGDSENEYVANQGDIEWLACQHNLWDSYSNVSIAFTSSDDSVVTVNEDGRMETLSVGDATITAVATLDDGVATMEAELAVHVIEPETPNVWIDSEARVVKIGQTVGVYMDYDNTNTYGPRHSFVSLNPDVLEQAYDEYGNEQFGVFYAKAIGEATIRIDASYGSGENEKTAEAFETIRVIPGDPELYLEGDSFTLRPGQTRIMPVRFADNGSGLTLAEEPEYTFWVDYGDSVTVSETTLEDGTYAISVTANDTASSPLINVSAKLSDGSEVYASEWMDMVSDESVYLGLGYDGSTWIDLTDEEYGAYGMTRDIWVNVDTNAYLAEGADTLEITWTADNPDVVTFDESQADEYGNGMRIVANTAGGTNVYANVKVTAGSIERESSIGFWINVYDASCDIVFGEDAYTLYVAQQQYLNLYPNCSNTLGEVNRIYYSDNEAVAVVNQSNYIFAVAPGTANIVCRIVFSNGAYVEESVPVTVIGAAAAWADASMNEVTLEVGEAFTLTPEVTWSDASLGYEEDSYWENTNGNVVSINPETGEITALNPGTAVVSYWQNVYYYMDETQTSTMWGECFVYSTITVTGDAKVSLSEQQITLAGESTHQLELIVNDETLGEPTSITWEARDYTFVDENGLVSVNSQHRVFYGTVAATAAFADGSEYTAYCSVTVNPKQFNPYEWQFGSGKWTKMDYNSVENYHDMVEVFDRNVSVVMTFESSNTDIATVDENGNIYTHETAGDADVTVTMKGYVNGVYTGESYVRSYRVRVGVDTLPTWIEVANGAKVVAMKHWGSAYLEIEKDPYTDCTIEFYSSDESIASFDWGYTSPYIIFHDKTGMVTVDVVVPERPSLNTTVEVLVVDQDTLFLTAADGSTTFTEGEDVQLVVSGQTWDDDDVERIDWVVGQYDDSFELTSDGMLIDTANTSENGSNNWVYANITFKCGNTVMVNGYFDIVSATAE